MGRPPKTCWRQVHWRQRSGGQFHIRWCSLERQRDQNSVVCWSVRSFLVRKDKIDIELGRLNAKCQGDVPAGNEDWSRFTYIRATNIVSTEILQLSVTLLINGSNSGRVGVDNPSLVEGGRGCKMASNEVEVKSTRYDGQNGQERLLTTLFIYLSHPKGAACATQEGEGYVPEPEPEPHAVASRISALRSNKPASLPIRLSGIGLQEFCWSVWAAMGGGKGGMEQQRRRAESGERISLQFHMTLCVRGALWYNSPQFVLESQCYLQSTCRSRLWYFLH